MIIYEYPLNERIRTLLRLEDLFDRVHFFIGQNSAHEHQAGLNGIFEILEVSSRGDLKSDMLQELDRQRAFLDALRDNPAISEEKLNEVLGEIQGAFGALLAASGKTGQHLRENEWLMTIKQRSAIPGGVCEFDVPSFHQWLHRNASERRADLQEWIKPLLPVFDALRIVLRVLRESGKPVSLIAYQGVFQQAPAERVAQMLRPRSEVPTESKRYGLGFWLDATGPAVMLEGMDAGVSFHSRHDAGTGLTWTVVSNTTDGAWPIARHLRDVLPG